MAAPTLYLFEGIEDRTEFVEKRFHKSIMFMRSILTHKPTVPSVLFSVLAVAGTKTLVTTMDGAKLSEDLRKAMGLELVREWTLVRRGKDVFFVGESSEAIIADNVVPMEIRVEGGQDAERCWTRA